AVVDPASRRRRLRDDFRKTLLKWHLTQKSSHAWRNGASPWEVLVAEMCLDRMRPDKVIPAYEKLRELLPSPSRTAKKASEVRRAMRTLGLQRRIDKVLDAGRVLINDFGGKVPDSESQLRSVAGVGDHVASAVITFGFG